MLRAIARFFSHSNSQTSSLHKDYNLVPTSMTANPNTFYQISKAGKLLKATEYAQYEKAEFIVKEDPSLIFEPVHMHFPDGTEKHISPLRYAFKVYDTEMWKNVFYARVKDDEAYRKQFLKQMREQEEEADAHLDFQRFFQACEAYEAHYSRWVKEELSHSGLNNEWYKLGKIQKEILPVHMLKEFSRQGKTWHELAPFHHNKRPQDCRIYDFHKSEWRSLSSILSDPNWGVTFALMRGANPGVGWIGRNAVECQVGHDLMVFRQLYEIRSEELAREFMSLSKIQLQKCGVKN